jgi:hypothetical protein
LNNLKKACKFITSNYGAKSCLSDKINELMREFPTYEREVDRLYLATRVVRGIFYNYDRYNLYASLNESDYRQLGTALKDKIECLISLDK